MLKILKKKRWLFCLVSAALLSCTATDSVKPQAAAKVKNIIMVIGDGMGPPASRIIIVLCQTGAA